MKNKTVITSIRIRPVDREKIKRVFGIGIGSLIKVILALCEENQYIRNKIREKIE